LVLGFVRRDEEGIASGAANALRELGGVFGVAVLASVFASHGSYLSPAAFAEGMRAAIAVGAVAVAVATVALVGVPRRRSLTVELHADTATAGELAAAAA
jgi:hypothetical protein